AAIRGFVPARMVEHVGLQRADIAGQALPVRRRDQIKARSRLARAYLHGREQPPQTALVVLIGQAADLARDRVGDLLGDQAPGVEREIGEQRRGKQDEDQQIDERQLERRGAQQLAECDDERVLQDDAPSSLSEKSSSQNSSEPRWSPCRFAASARRSSTRRIFPEMVFGRSANSRRRTRLNGATAARQCRNMESAVARSGVWPAASTR